MDYTLGLTILREYAEQTDWRPEFLVYEYGLQESLYEERLYGASERCRVARTKVVDQLNQLAGRQCGVSFNDLCNASGQQTRVPCSARLDDATVEREIPFS